MAKHPSNDEMPTTILTACLSYLHQNPTLAIKLRCINASSAMRTFAVLLCLTLVGPSAYGADELALASSGETKAVMERVTGLLNAFQWRVLEDSALAPALGLSSEWKSNFGFTKDTIAASMYFLRGMDRVPAPPGRGTSVFFQFQPDGILVEMLVDTQIIGRSTTKSCKLNVIGPPFDSLSRPLIIAYEVKAGSARDEILPDLQRRVELIYRDLAAQFIMASGLTLEETKAIYPEFFADFDLIERSRIQRAREDPQQFVGATPMAVANAVKQFRARMAPATTAAAGPSPASVPPTSSPGPRN